MTTKKSGPASKPKSTAAPTASQAWQNVLARVSDLGDAIEQWTKTAASEADAKEKFEQVRSGIKDIADKADTALGNAESKLGQQAKKGAEEAGQAFGDAAQRMREAAEPHVRDAFAGLSDIFGKAAERMGEPSPAQPKKPSTTPAKARAASKKK